MYLGLVDGAAARRIQRSDVETEANRNGMQSNCAIAVCSRAKQSAGLVIEKFGEETRKSVFALFCAILRRHQGPTNPQNFSFGMEGYNFARDRRYQDDVPADCHTLNNVRTIMSEIMYFFVWYCMFGTVH